VRASLLLHGAGGEAGLDVALEDGDCCLGLRFPAKPPISESQRVPVHVQETQAAQASLLEDAECITCTVTTTEWA
jgi:hypothetical protein